MSSQPSNPVQLGPVESLLQCILTFLSATGKANRTRSHSSAAFISAKPVIGKFRLWARSFDTDCNLDRLLAEDAVLWETVILLLSSFIAGTAEAFGFLCDTDTINDLKSALSNAYPKSATNTDASEDSGSESSTGSIEDEGTALSGVTTSSHTQELGFIVDSLFSLLPILEQTTEKIIVRESRLAEPTPEPLETYFTIIKARYPNAESWLARRLAKGVLDCSNCIRSPNKKEQIAKPVDEVVVVQRDLQPVTLADSAFGTSLGSKAATFTVHESLRTPWTPATATNSNTMLSPVRSTPTISVLSEATTIESSIVANVLPPLPKGGTCPICNESKQIATKAQWSKHIFIDLEPYMCLVHNCQLQCKSYKRLREWMKHDRMCCGTRSEAQCPFGCCVDNMSGDNWYKHVGHHVKDIRLLALPPSLYGDGDGDDLHFDSNSSIFSSSGVGRGDAQSAIGEEPSESEPQKSLKYRLRSCETVEKKRLVEDWVCENRIDASMLFYRMEGWRIPDYFSSVDNDLSNAITITKVGQTQYIAKKAGEFLHTEFPWAGRHLLEILCDLCGEVTKTKKDMNKDVQQKRWLDIKDEPHYSRLCLHIKASYNFLEVSTEGAGLIAIRFGEIVDALRWIVAAIVPRNNRTGLYGSRLIAIRGDTPWITTLELTQLATPPQNSCWTHMFLFACVVNDAPRFCRYFKSFLDPGLTLDFNLLVELAAVEREVLSTEGVFLLGFDTALIPLEPLERKRWHFVYKPGKQMTSQDISSHHLHHLPRLIGKEYQQGIISVGWCAASVIIMGTRKDGVNTKESKIDMALEKRVKAETSRAIHFQVAVQGGIGGSALTGTIGYQRQITHKQGAVVSLRSPADNYRGILTQSSSTRVILFDNGTKRAWLVPAVVVLLYACLCLIENEEYQLFEEECGQTKPFTYASESHNASKSSADALRSNQNIFMRRTSSDKPEAFSELVKDVWHDMARGENICKNDATGHLEYENNWVFGYDLTEAILGKNIHLRGFKANGATEKWAILTEVIPVIFVADVGQVIQTKDCSISCKDLSGTEGLLSCTVHDLSAVSQFICHKQWNLLGDPWAASSSCSSTSAGPCVYCSELQRIQTICHPSNNLSFLERMGRGRKVTVEKRMPDALTEAAFQAMKHHQQGAVRFGKHS